MDQLLPCKVRSTFTLQGQINFYLARLDLLLLIHIGSDFFLPIRPDFFLPCSDLILPSKDVPFSTLQGRTNFYLAMSDHF